MVLSWDASTTNFWSPTDSIGQCDDEVVVLIRELLMVFVLKHMIPLWIASLRQQVSKCIVTNALALGNRSLLDEKFVNVGIPMMLHTINFQ